MLRAKCCILLKFYIKPQLVADADIEGMSCILLKFYIKPQLKMRFTWSLPGCILLKFYIKPQPMRSRSGLWKVVSYWNSTSNHNCLFDLLFEFRVVSYWNSTSNHNSARRTCRTFGLYLIEILHQTTTPGSDGWCSSSLYLIEILHQTTTWIRRRRSPPRCILLKFYIKPQLLVWMGNWPHVVSYWNSTSNHNSATKS